ncbi:hypothetical protein LH128_16653 [Sphingomonas sp. LH128]|uniref:hypothetical protein n=1 Tax=Sphingomonas sp. LH128 TaxID=473781 RepID=UPI00027CC55C|nr:hypothetical protein [Sphingomonas sp. LH128]EJU11875.1 hypothetical protein LH128_16653 [Sphingomonas sp. LH128]
MAFLDIDAIRAEVRALDFVRGSPAEHAMLRDEAVPPPLATQIILKLHGHPDADPTLAITPLERIG